jgi:hypothetical protein
MMTEEGMGLDRINKIYRIGKDPEFRGSREGWTGNGERFMALVIA